MFSDNNHFLSFFNEFDSSYPKGYERFIEQCEILYSLLTETNSHTNLTRIVDKKDFFIKHIYDSLLILKFKPELSSVRDIKILDLGCGAGFPSLVLAMVLKRCTIFAVDSTGKKTAFVQKVKNELNLSNLTVITARGRELAAKNEFRNFFDLFTARAVAEGRKLFKEVRPALKNNSEMIFYKTPAAAEAEIEPLKKISPGIDWKISPSFYLPYEMGTRCFLYGRKSSS